VRLAAADGYGYSRMGGHLTMHRLQILPLRGSETVSPVQAMIRVACCWLLEAGSRIPYLVVDSQTLDDLPYNNKPLNLSCYLLLKVRSCILYPVTHSQTLKDLTYNNMMLNLSYGMLMLITTSSF
jgi:hypothetical protein